MSLGSFGSVCFALARGALLATLFAGASGAQAQQMYRCPSGGSGYVLSDRPCVGVPSKLGAFGSVASSNPGYSTPSYSSTPVEKAPEFLPLLSPGCAQLNEAIRTASSRGLKYSAVNELRVEYNNKCSEEEHEARQKASERKRQASDQRKQQKNEILARQAATANAAAQCDELLRITHSKRQRYDTLTPGQKDDLQRFESNYKQRCSRS